MNADHLLGVLAALFFFAGRFDISRLSIGVAIEPRLLFLLILIAGVPIAFRGWRRYLALPREVIAFVALYALFVVWLFGQAALVGLPSAADEKVLDVGLMSIALFATVALLATTKRHGAFIGGFMVAGVTMALLYSAVIVASSVAGGGRGTITVGGPNVATRVLFIGLIACLYFHFSRRLSLLPLIAAALIAPSIILIGSRGGIVGAIATAGIAGMVLMLRGRLRLRALVGRRALLGFAVLLAIGWLLRSTIAAVWHERVTLLLLGRLHFAGRDLIYQKSLAYIVEQPIIGYGLGAYNELNIGNVYPHNLFLELALDAGLFGLLVGMVWAAWAMALLIRARAARSFLLALIPIYFLVVQQFSGDLYDFRYFFVFMMLAATVQATETRVSVTAVRPPGYTGSRGARPRVAQVANAAADV